MRLDRDSAGRVMCQLCFGFFDVDELNIVDEGPPTRVEDVCRDCAELEAEIAEPELT
jgi:hypothetical protein